MSDPRNGGAPTGTTDRAGGPPPPQAVARDQAAQVGRSTTDAGRRVAGTAADQAGAVAQETRRQAADLLQQARAQATEQARGGQQQAVKGLRSLATELHQMSDGGDEHGPASDLAKQAAGRVEDVAGWLERHEPGDLLGEVRRLARRRPGAFLVGAALAGVVAGRLTRGAVDAKRDTGPSAADTQPVGIDRPAAAYPPPPPMPGQVPGGAALPPQGPLGAPGGPPPYAPGSAPPAHVPGAAPPAYVPGSAPPAGVAGPGFAGPGAVGPGPDAPGPAGTGPVAPPPPAHAPRPGTTVGEYVDDLRRTGPGDPGSPR